jgi:four helix bundle protein
MIPESRQIINNVRELRVYQAAFRTVMEIYRLTEDFPKDEKYSMTDQIRRSSRSVCSNLAEGWHKRRYPAAFINKLTDAIQEASETQTWLEFSLACGYICRKDFEQYLEEYEHIIAQLITMERKTTSFCKPH